MNTSISTPLGTHALRTSTFAALFLGLIVTAPAYGQMAALSARPKPSASLSRETLVTGTEHIEGHEILDRMAVLSGGSVSPTALVSGTEHILDGGFEGGIGNVTYGSQGLSGSGDWTWWNGTPSSDGTIYFANALSPIWRNSGGTNARTGQYMVYFNPFGPSVTDVAQFLTIKSGEKATLSFWLKIMSSSSTSSKDYLVVYATDYGATTWNPTTLAGFDASNNFGNNVGTWAQYTVDVSSLTGKTIDLHFQTNIDSTCIFMLDDVSLFSIPSDSATCTEDAFTMCLVNGRYKVTSHWLNQYSTPPGSANLNKVKLSDNVGAFWIADANTYEYFIRFNTATTNGKIWVNVSTFTSVEFWVSVTDTVNGQTKEYHSPAGTDAFNTVNIWDPYFFVYP